MTPAEIIMLTNQYRAEQNMPPLSEDATLSKAALKRAEDMAVTNNFSHSVATSSPLTNAFMFMKDAGYSFENAGENLARGYNSSGETVSGWKKSPTHNKNLMDMRYSNTGVAVVKSPKDGKYYVVQFFGSPKKGVSRPGKQTSKPEPVVTTSNRTVTRRLTFNNQPSFSVANSTPKTRRLTDI